MGTHVDTVDHGWDDEQIQDYACRAATRGNGNTVRDVVIYSHSMGNNIFGAALKNKKCSLGNNSYWFSMGAPWLGSQAAIALTNWCTGHTIGDEALRWLSDKLNYCEGRRVTPVWSTL